MSFFLVQAKRIPPHVEQQLSKRSGSGIARRAVAMCRSSVTQACAAAPP
jgi:hypothetical protein